ncbi:hypothetical protein [Pseudonocardia sp.]|jgi:hypothetical protein|uniref:hypothetical protein n=1 Tax=Pseudonocardia sp. TaxID=60912 RepID=UPI0031FDEAA3
MRALGTVVAPTTLLTSLLFYFGWSHAYWFFDYFGVNSTMLGLTTTDYLMRSLDGLFIPMTVLGCAGLIAVWGHTMILGRLVAGTRPRVFRVFVLLITIGGLLLAVAGLLSVFVRTELNKHLAVAPMSLGIGVVLVAYGAHLKRHLAIPTEGPGRATKLEQATKLEWAAVAEWAAVFVLVGLSLFWAANDYSAAVGQRRARQLADELPTYSDAVVYSSRSLSLAAPGVREVRCKDREGSYRFRYDGLKLVLQSGDQYVFLPAAWSATDGVAILLPRSDSLRLEFFPASAHGIVRPSTC